MGTYSTQWYQSHKHKEMERRWNLRGRKANKTQVEEIGACEARNKFHEHFDKMD